ncbi:TetR/AcrR family transcriptional regulator [Pseudoroseicyclus sp. CXY001]|uniref:TetR/AcrR family transcriptional regulator n=1 Tax=Pseudoroseicyclus sp. CXY001 TaxID=3242492 RepID=UPI0035713FEB
MARQAQKSRTREAILAAARELVAEGQAVTVHAAAEAAGVSRATAYRYFSDPSVLAAEAGLAVAVAPYEEVVAGAETPQARLLAVALYMFDLALANEPAFRHFLARWLDAWAAGEGGPTRGARRVEMFERALGPGRAGLSPEEAAALVRGLTMATGSEAMIALLDIARSDPAEARASVAEVAGLLIRRYLG